MEEDKGGFDDETYAEMNSSGGAEEDLIPDFTTGKIHYKLS